MPASLHMGTTKYWFIPFALITVAIPAQATRKSPFSLQLQGPFCADVRAEFSPIYRSLTAGSALTRPSQCLCLFNYDGLYAKNENCQVNYELCHLNFKSELFKLEK